MDKGDLVPDKVTIKMLEEEVKRNANAKGFLFDGFPRTKSQAEALDNFLDKNKMEISAPISLLVNTCLSFALSTFNILPLNGRLAWFFLSLPCFADPPAESPSTINESKIINRFKEYNEKTAPLIAYYNDQNKFYTVSGIGSIDIITNRLVEVIDSL